MEAGFTIWWMSDCGELLELEPELHRLDGSWLIGEGGLIEGAFGVRAGGECDARLLMADEEAWLGVRGETSVRHRTKVSRPTSFLTSRGRSRLMRVTPPLSTAE